MNNRDEAIREAMKLKLSELAENIIHGEYTPGIEDDILIARLQAVEGE